MRAELMEFTVPDKEAAERDGDDVEEENKKNTRNTADESNDENKTENDRQKESRRLKEGDQEQKCGKDRPSKARFRSLASIYAATAKPAANNNSSRKRGRSGGN